MHEARIDATADGRSPSGEGWFLLNLGEMPWETVPGFGVWRDLDGSRVAGGAAATGIHVHVLQPGETNGHYHAEDVAEGILVLSGECLALVEGRELAMRQWDWLHSPPGTAHGFVGAGEGPCAILMFGAPDPSRKVEWIADATAARHGASPARTTGSSDEAYGELPAERAVPAPAPFDTRSGNDEGPA